MQIDEELKKLYPSVSNVGIVPDDIFKKLLQNCFAVLAGSSELHNMNGLYNSKPDAIKEVYAALLSITAQFVRTGHSKEAVSTILNEKCGLNPSRIALFVDYYEKNFEVIETSLLNIGSHLPHITDVSWKIDYIVKSAYLDSSDGPIFRIGLQTEQFDPSDGNKKIEYINFSCTSQELHDLVHKLKDAVRHCQRIGSDHN